MLLADAITWPDVGFTFALFVGMGLVFLVLWFITKD